MKNENDKVAFLARVPAPSARTVSPCPPILHKICFGHFYNVMSALSSLTYFQISGISMLEINSEMVSKSFIIFPFSTQFFKHASDYGYPQHFP